MGSNQPIDVSEHGTSHLDMEFRVHHLIKVFWVPGPWVEVLTRLVVVGLKVTVTPKDTRSSMGFGSR